MFKTRKLYGNSSNPHLGRITPRQAKFSGTFACLSCFFTSAVAAKAALGFCYSSRDPVPWVENVYLEGKINPVSFGVHEWTYTLTAVKNNRHKNTAGK